MVNMRRGVQGLGAIGLLVLALVLWRSRGSDQPATPTKPTETTGSAQHHRTHTDVPRGRPWFAPLGIGGRRIAGVVTTADGAPVGGAIVRIGSDASSAGLVAAPRLVTDDNGRFDAGELAALPYIVSAEARGLTPALQAIDAGSPNTRPPVDKLHLVLHPCVASIHGTILDTASGVVPGARVTITDGDGILGGGVDADARGAYELCVAPGGQWIAVTADGYAAHTTSVTVFGRTRRDFELVPGATVVGRVVRAADQTAVAGALVELRGRDRDTLPLRTTSNEEGRFEIAGVPPGRHYLTAAADRLSTAEPVDVDAQIGTPADDVVCPLVAAYAVMGTVVEQNSGKPISGVTVHVASTERTAREPSAVSQPDGSFVIERVIPGEYQLMTNVDPWAPPEQRRVQVASADLTGVVVELARGGTIAGRVLHEGKPVAGTQVRTEGGPFWGTTDHEGRFSLEHVPPGGYKLYAESHRHGAFARSKDVAVIAGETQNIDLELDLAGSIEGIVVDQTGAPVPSVFVRFTLLGGEDYGAATTAEDGTFKARSLSGGGNYAYEVRKSDTSPLVFPPAQSKRFSPVYVGDGNAHVTGLRIAIRYERHTIAGTVVDADGTPQPDVVVRAERVDNRFAPASSTSTDARGAFTLRDLPTGAYVVEARSVSGEIEEEKVEAGRMGLVLKLRPFTAIEGRLQGFTTTPQVFARNESGEGYDGRLRGDTFRFRDLAPGTYEVIALSQSEVGMTRTTTTPGTPVTITIAKLATGTIEGTVRDEKTRRPLAEVHCRSELRGGDRKLTFTYTMGDETTTAGTFRLERALPGVHDITCTSLTATVTGTATVLAGQVARVELVTAPRAKPRVPRAGLDFEEQFGDLRVKSVVAGGPAARAGVAVGDALVKFDNAVAEDWPEWRPQLEIEEKQIGDAITLVFERGDKQLTVVLVLE